MGNGYLIDFLLEATFGVAFDTISQRFVDYQNNSAMKTLTAPQQEAFFQSIMLVMLADGRFSTEERALLKTKLQKIPNPEEAWALVEEARKRASEALHEKREQALIDDLVAALPEKHHRRTLVNLLWDLHRIDEQSIEAKMDILDRFFRTTGLLPAGID